MATIRKLRGRWQAQVRRRGMPNRAKSFDLKSDAERWARDLEAVLDRGAFGYDTRKAERMTVRELLDRYRKEMTPKKRGAVAEQQKIDVLLKSQLVHYTLTTLTSEIIAQYRDRRLATVAPATINRELSILSHAIDTARREWGIRLHDNPLHLVSRPSPARARERRLGPGEEARLLEAASACQNPFVAPLIVFAIETGMRRGEMLGLRWEDVDFERRVAHLEMTKNGDPRDVPLSARAIEELRSLYASRMARATDNVKSDEYVFPIHYHAFNGAWRRLVRRAGLVDLRLHDLRHEAVSRFFELGFDAMEVSAISGHRSFAMLRRYTHLRAEGLAERLG